MIALPPETDGPRIFEVMPVIFDLLAALDDWADPSGLDTEPEFAQLLVDLTAHGLVEVYR